MQVIYERCCGLDVHKRTITACRLKWLGSSWQKEIREFGNHDQGSAGTLYHMGIKSRVSRSTLADANENRDWRIYADFAQSLIAIARRLYAAEPLPELNL